MRTTSLTKTFGLSLLAAATTFIASTAAFADDISITRDCTAQIGDHTVEAISTPATDGSFSSRLLVDGQEVQPLTAGCWRQVVPVFRGGAPIVTRYIKCAFPVGDDRLELYPVTETTSGQKKFMQFIVWQGDRVKAGSFDNCAE